VPVIVDFAEEESKELADQYKLAGTPFVVKVI
jgi:hypothetical protein